MMEQIKTFFVRALSLSGGSLKEPRLNELFGSTSTSDAGVSVTPWTAMNYSAVYAAVKVISESISSLPLNLYERLEKGGKEKANANPLYDLVHDAPNPDMGSLQWRQASMAHLLLWGNSYSEIVRDVAGNPVEIWPIDPSMVEAKRDENYEIYYVINGKLTLARDEVLHISGLSFDGVSGLSPISAARQSIGLALAIEQFGSGYFGRGARPGGVLKFPGQLSPEARINLRRSFEDLHAGGANSHRVALLEQGLEWQAIGVPPDDSQFLQSREFQIIEVARWFNIPPHKIKDLSKSNYSSLEQMNIEYLTDTLRPWLVRWEQQLNQKLLSPADRNRYFFEHNIEGTLRGDQASRYAAYAIARNWGWLSVNEIREKENMNAIDGGNSYLQPLNMQGLDTAPTAAPATAPTIGITPTTGITPMTAPATPTVDVAATALNGAQISSLIELVSQVGKSLISIESGKAIAIASFPFLSASVINSIFSGPTNPSAPTIAGEPARESNQNKVLLRLLDNAGEWLQSIECKAVQRFSHNPKEFIDKLEKFCDEHRIRVSAAYLPVLEAFSLESDIESHTQRHLDQFINLWIEFSGTVSAASFSDEVLKKITTIRGDKNES